MKTGIINVFEVRLCCFSLLKVQIRSTVYDNISKCWERDSERFTNEQYHMFRGLNTVLMLASRAYSFFRRVVNDEFLRIYGGKVWRY